MLKELLIWVTLLRYHNLSRIEKKKNMVIQIETTPRLHWEQHPTYETVKISHMEDDGSKLLICYNDWLTKYLYSHKYKYKKLVRKMWLCLIMHLGIKWTLKFLCTGINENFTSIRYHLGGVYIISTVTKHQPLVTKAKYASTSKRRITWYLHPPLQCLVCNTHWCGRRSL